MLRRFFIVALALCASWVAPCRGQDTLKQEADRLSTLLKWHPGSVVAEIGAGDGNLTLAASQVVGPLGKVYSTEIDAKLLTHLKELAQQEKNITAIQAAEAGTNLPPACCDSMVMRLVYHHLTKPAEIDASVFLSLRTGGRLAVIDEDPQEGTLIPKGVPQDRGGHGVSQIILMNELVAAGFEVETVVSDWPGRDESHQIYCVVFRKP